MKIRKRLEDPGALGDFLQLCHLRLLHERDVRQSWAYCYLWGIRSIFLSPSCRASIDDWESIGMSPVSSACISQLKATWVLAVDQVQVLTPGAVGHDALD